MPDIMMCVNEECNKRKNCYRYRAIPQEFGQSYACFQDRGCTFFWEIEKGQKVRAMDEIENNGTFVFDIVRKQVMGK